MRILPNRVYIVLEYLIRGGKVKMDGRTYVWLDNQVVDETATHTYYIDGLAIEGRSYKPNEDWKDPTAGKPHYTGQNDMPVSHFLQSVTNIERTEYSRICTEFANMLFEERSSNN